MPGRRLRACHRHSKAARKGELPRRYRLRITWLLLRRAEGHAVLCRRDIARAYYAAYLYRMSASGWRAQLRYQLIHVCSSQRPSDLNMGSADRAKKPWDPLRRGTHQLEKAG